MTTESQNANSLALHGTFLRDLSFENPHMPYKMQTIETQSKIDISYGIEVNALQENFFDVTLNTYIKSEINSESLFIVEISYAGVFNIIAEDQNEREKMLYVNCPQILHPFIRSLIANLVLEGGLPALLIQPVDFYNLYLEKKKETSFPNIESSLNN